MILLFFKKGSVLPKENFVISFRNRVFDRVNFGKILGICRDSFPLNKSCVVRSAFKYEKPLKKLLCNYNAFCKDLGANSEAACYCTNEVYKDFVDQVYGHIITGILAIIKNKTLGSIMEKGSKFRLENNLKFSNIFDLFQKEHDLFILKISYKYVWPVEDFRLWKYKILEYFKLNYLSALPYYKKL